ncbi:MAG: DUF1893 domain-containing protein [Candidatus Bathyarchaeum sp.]|nr:MAG: DUF1893 domain-containing protein [Candidatus Bathyarchaeum sp.]
MAHQSSDVEIAKSQLIGKNLSLVIAKNGQVIFETKKPGIGGFLQVIEQFDTKLSGSSVADRIVGVAAAMLCVYIKVDSVFALTISEGGMKVLKDSGVTFEFKNKVSNILNRDKTDVCPFEKRAMASKNAEEAYVSLKAFAKKIMGKPTKPC